MSVDLQRHTHIDVRSEKKTYIQDDTRKKSTNPAKKGYIRNLECMNEGDRSLSYYELRAPHNQEEVSLSPSTRILSVLFPFTCDV